MSDPRSYDALIDRLSTDLVPVRRLRPPAVRTAGWLLLVAVVAVVLVMHFGLGGMTLRFANTPDLAWAAVGALATAITAAWAAFALSVPGRGTALAWLPLPAALLWIGASGLGCLRQWIAPGTQISTAHQSADCLVFIIGFSVPLSIAMVMLLRRAYPVRPILTAVMVGLASAAASASLLEICHAYDATATDLLSHVLAVGVVVAVNAAMGGRLLTKG